MARNFVSQFCTDQSNVHAFMEGNSEFSRVVAEFCTQFGLKVESIRGASVELVTEEGISVGTLTLCRGSSDQYFKFSADGLIRKQKASSRSSHNERDSVKITGIVNAMKKANEMPTYDKLTGSYRHAILCAISAAYSLTRRKPKIEVTDEDLVGLLRSYVQADQYSLVSRKDALTEKLRDYDAHLNRIAERQAELHRFNDCYVIGVCRNNRYSEESRHYLIGEATYEPAVSKVTLTTKLERHATLKETRHAPLAMMIRTYAEGNKKYYDEDNELGLRRMDEYIEDLDIAVGYSDAKSVWVVIPKHGA